MKSNFHQRCLSTIRSASALVDKTAYSAFIRGGDARCIRLIRELALNFFYNRRVAISATTRRLLVPYRLAIKSIAGKRTTDKTCRGRLIKEGPRLLQALLRAYDKTFGGSSRRHKAAIKSKPKKKKPSKN